MHTFKLVGLALVVLTLPTILKAQQWTYADCVTWAMKHNIPLEQLRLAQQTSALTLEAAQAQWQPSLTAQTSQSLSNAPWGAAGTNRNAYSSDYGLNAQWSVWNGNRRPNTIKRERLQIRIDSTKTLSYARTLHTDILSMYIDILYAREAIAINAQTAQTSQAQALRAKELMTSGRLSRVDYMQLQAQADQDAYSVVSAQGTYDSRRMDLKRLLQLALDQDLDVAEVTIDTASILTPLPPLEESYAMAVEQDASLRGARLAVDQAQVERKIAKAGAAPSITLGAGIGTGYNAPGQPWGTQMKWGLSENIGLTLSIPILDRKSTHTAVAKADIQQLNSTLDVDNRLNELSQLIQQLYIEATSAQARYRAGEVQVEATALSADLAGQQFALGRVNPVELLTANNAYAQARHALAQAKYMALLQTKLLQFYRTSQVSL